MLNSQLSLVAISPTPVVYNQLPTQPGGPVVRIDIASNASEPDTLSIGSRVIGKGALLADVRTVTFQQIELDLAGQQIPLKVSFQVQLPRAGVFTDADVKQMITQLVNFVSVDANRQALLRGEA